MMAKRNIKEINNQEEMKEEERPLKKRKLSKQMKLTDTKLKNEHVNEITPMEKKNEFELKIISGDLFTSPSTASLVHCISRDLKMGKGIAKIFRNKFGKVNEMKKQNCQIGECAIIKNNKRFIYNMITKEKYYNKPTYTNLKKSLIFCKTHAMTNNVNHICMPKIGCGLDKLKWNKVHNIIHDVFKDTNINIDVYVL